MNKPTKPISSLKRYRGEDMLLKLFLIVAFVYISLFVLLIIFSFGKSKGYDEARDNQKKYDCQSEYSLTPKNEVPIVCLQYFDFEKKI